MIAEKKKFIKTVLESLKNNFSDWKIYKSRVDEYVIENKYNKFKIERDLYPARIKIIQPIEVNLSIFSGAGALRRKIKRICKQYDHGQLVHKFQTLNKLFDIRTVLILDIDLYTKNKNKNKNKKIDNPEEFWEESYNDLKSELDESLSGEISYIQRQWRCDVYIYFEKEEDMSFVILKYSDFLKM